MVTKEVLLEKFQITGCDNLSDEVLQKCVELCIWYDKDEEEFIDMWVAFGISHANDDLEPTLKSLEEMKRLNPRKINLEKPVDEPSKINFSEAVTFEHQNEEDDILEAYMPKEKLKLLTKRTRTPEPEVRANEDTCKSQSNVESAASPRVSSNSSQTSVQNGSQSDSGKVLGSFGPKIESWVTGNKQRFAIKRAGAHVPANAMYMFELLKTTSDVRTRVCRTIGGQFCAAWCNTKKDDVPATWNVRTRLQKNYRTWGRVCCETEEKDANAAILLEGCRKPSKTSSTEMKWWPNVELDLSAFNHCALFPGQIIAVEGTNLTESVIKVQEIYAKSFLPAPPTPSLSQKLHVMLATGPYTGSNDLNYQPLWDLMNRVVVDEPHLLILVGPFLDHTHPHVQDGSLQVTFQEFFEKTVDRIMGYVKGLCTEVVLVASNRDVHHHSVYPTPEYALSKMVQHPNLHVMPDPCYLDIEGVRIGITSIDTLMHLGREEITPKASGLDKLSRLINYILDQACYYPLYPTAADINVDAELWEKYAFLKEKPHITILPSDMRHFCKHVNESVVINPGRLSKRSFARMVIHPVDNNSWSDTNVSCEMIKV